MELQPLYKLNDILLIGLKADFAEIKVIDGLVLKISLKDGSILNDPWSLQKMLKFGYYHPVKENEKEDLSLRIYSTLDKIILNEMEDSLLNPSREAIDSLVWLPERLKEENRGEKGYNLRNTVKQLVIMRQTLFGEAINYAMNHELRDINKDFDAGETYTFQLGYLDNSEDANLQLLVDLIKQVEKTTASIANLNRIDLDEYDA